MATRDKNRHLRSIIASSPKAFITSTRFSRSKTELQKRHRNSQNRVRPSTWNQEPSIQKIWRRCTRPMTTCSLVTNSGNHKRKRIKSARTLPVEVVAREVVKAVCAGAKESKLRGVQLLGILVTIRQLAALLGILWTLGRTHRARRLSRIK